MRFQACIYIAINELIFPWARCWNVSHDDQRSITLRSEAFSSAGFCCISQFVKMEIIYKQCKLRRKHTSHSFGQNPRSLMMEVRVSYASSVLVVSTPVFTTAHHDSHQKYICCAKKQSRKNTGVQRRKGT